MENSTFKSVTFGGFAKQDVIDYIEKSALEAAKAQEMLTAENEELRSAKETLTAQLESLHAQVEVLTAERERLQADLERESAAHQELEPLQAEVERLLAETERLRPDAEAYAQFRERIGAIECEARKRAADLESTTRAELRRTVDQFRTRYGELMSTFDATAAHVTGELRKVEVNLTQLPRAMDQSGAKLEELSALLERTGEA